MDATIMIKRIYEAPEGDDGYRVLVDRIWPRGISKEKAQIDVWMKEIAPPHDLRKWFNHEPEKFTMFKDKYLDYLNSNEVPTELLHELKNKRYENTPITLVYAAKDEVHNQAIILQELLLSESK